MMNMQDFKIVKKGRAYFLTDPDHPEESYKVQKPNGKIVCNCPDFRNAPPGTCDHIEALREHAQAQSPEPTETGGRLVTSPHFSQYGRLAAKSVN